ncbi:hypothetical protein KR032_006514 [Drosophila birchii]|nr:hypothetical protein KR032_006514 [Drosophila birchii]
MKHFVLCALAALVLFQAAAFGFKVNRVIYVVTQTNSTANATTPAPATNATVAPTVIVYCTWKNNWCRPASNTVRNCKWGLCKFSG